MAGEHFTSSSGLLHAPSSAALKSFVGCRRLEDLALEPHSLARASRNGPRQLLDGHHGRATLARPPSAARSRSTPHDRCPGMLATGRLCRQRTAASGRACTGHRGCFRRRRRRRSPVALSAPSGVRGFPRSHRGPLSRRRRSSSSSSSPCLHTRRPQTAASGSSRLLLRPLCPLGMADPSSRRPALRNSGGSRLRWSLSIWTAAATVAAAAAGRARA